MELLVLLFIFFSTLSFLVHSCAATDTISVNQSIRDGETIVSASSSFELGFFSPLANSTSKKRYFGVWYKFSNETVVWVANREMPLNDTSGVLQVTSQGILAIRGSNNLTVWLSSSANSSREVRNPIAQILDTGNFVVREADDTNEHNYIWQSFDWLGDTSLPGCRFGRNLVSGVEWTTVSWKSTTDPSVGDSTKGLDIRGYPQMYTKVGETVVFRSGPWNGLNFGGVNAMKPNPVYAYQLVFTEEEIYLKYEVWDKSVFFRMILRNGGVMQQFIWNNSTWKWDLHFTSWRDKCDTYALCGTFGSCNISNSTMCNCLEGFTPQFPQDWESGNWSGGCVRKNDLVCVAGDRFQRIDGVKLPDSRKSWFNRTMNLTECETECLKNCSCTAYSSLDISTGFGCLLWFGDLLDTRIYDGNGQSFYLRLGTSELGQIDRGTRFGKKKLVGIVVSAALLMGILMVGMILYICNKKHRKQGMAKSKHQMFFHHKEGKGEEEFPLFDLNTVVKATENFLEDNKLGEGGFGPVFRGTLVDGQDVAVKRLSNNSGQGLTEFKNEIVLIAKLQHRNLVRLLGCCIEGDEKLLIYEFMPNKSLNYFIFDPQRRTLLDWSIRSRIIDGIARGLLYLHQDSRLRIIHRDLKASNILLDANMNPKISDFGLARMISGDQTEAKTKKVFGTYGYMSPEYALDGLFSTKSDVFSFGVLLLEIVTGMPNRGFFSPDHSHNLLGHAWKLWTEERPLELVYDALDDFYAESEVKRCIQVGLLCVQQQPEDRPNMSSVVLMLGSESPLPQPKQPGFFTPSNISASKTSSANGMSITLLEPR